MSFSIIRLFPVLASGFLALWAAPVRLPAEPGGGTVRVNREPGGIAVDVGDRPFLYYHTAPVAPPPEVDPIFTYAAFIHPLFTPSGKVLTDPFPAGHVHHHGMFAAWARATFRNRVVDFWNHDDDLGRVESAGVIDVGEDRFSVKRRYIAAGLGPALDETWTATASARGGCFVLDLVIRQEAASAHEVYVHQYRYGGFAFRGPAEWNPDGPEGFRAPMRILTSEGETDRAAANHRRHRWVAAWGEIAGAPAGMAIMDHPRNFLHPQPVRVHPRMPYFVYSPVVERAFVIRDGFPYLARYRVVTFDGPPEAEVLEALYADFAGQSTN